uniref:uncharacterized protein LOC122601743 n=1 Tax=Erigeron canadensis TaxID=72917 RepID=UPI001CB8F6C0|nr:uncharacterized protein LOC122601743 [Erigeron canadensis]
MDDTAPPLDVEAIQSRIKQLTEIPSNCYDDTISIASDEADLLTERVPQLQGEIHEILERWSDVGSLKPQDFDTYLETVKGKICSIEAENASVFYEVGNVEKGCMEDYIQLRSNIEGLNSSLDFTQSQGLGTKRTDAQECSLLTEHQLESVGALGECKLKILKSSSQIEKKKGTLKLLEDLDYIFRRCEVVIKTENILTGLEVIKYEGNQISLSLRTCIPELEVSEQNHELAIEFLDDTLEIKNAEIFPNDVFIGEIIDAAKSFSCHFSLSPMPENKNSLEWFVRRVQDRIVVSTLRKSLVKAASKSRHSIEYIERDEMIVAHMVDGIDAFIKVSQGWPMSVSPLKLLSLKGSSQSSKEVTFSFLCRVEEMVKSLDVQVCQNLSTFIDAIEEFLKQKMHAELQSNGVKQK